MSELYSAEWRAKQSAAHRGRSKPASFKAKLSARMKLQWADPEWKEQQRARLSARFDDPAVRAAHADRVRSDWVGNDARREAFKEAMANPALLGPCYYCGDPGYIREHKVPKSRGGTDDPANIVISCRPCNSSKGRLTDIEFLAAGGRKR